LSTCGLCLIFCSGWVEAAFRFKALSRLSILKVGGSPSKYLVIQLSGPCTGQGREESILGQPEKEASRAVMLRKWCVCTLSAYIQES